MNGDEHPNAILQGCSLLIYVIRVCCLHSTFKVSGGSLTVNDSHNTRQKIVLILVTSYVNNRHKVRVRARIQMEIQHTISILSVQRTNLLTAGTVGRNVQLENFFA